MNNTARILLTCGMAFGLVASAQDAGFFRVVSNQQAELVSLDSAGLLVWSNAVPGAPCQVQVRRTVDGAWTNVYPTTPIRTNGSLLQARIPLCRVLHRWIVAFQPEVTLAQAEALFDANEIIWEPLAWNSLRMATISVPPEKSLSPITDSPSVRYVERDMVLELY